LSKRSHDLAEDALAYFVPRRGGHPAGFKCLPATVDFPALGLGERKVIGTGTNALLKVLSQADALGHGKM
jgi:hypothetical protein